MIFEAENPYTLEEQNKIKKLRDLVKKDDTLDIGTEEVLLTKFLHFTNWDVGRAHESIQRFYEFKERNPEWVAHHPVTYFREHFFFTMGKFLLPKPDKEGRAILVFKVVDAFNKFPNYLYDIIEWDDIIFESLLLIPRVQKYGIAIIYDLAGVTKNFLRILSPSIARLVNEKNDILPITSRIVHVLQKGFLMNATSSLIMPFMSKEFKERIFTHDGKSFDKLRDMIGYESLPAEYGGPAENVLDVNLLYNHMLNNADYLEKLQSYKKIAK